MDVTWKFKFNFGSSNFSFVWGRFGSLKRVLVSLLKLKLTPQFRKQSQQGPFSSCSGKICLSSHLPGLFKNTFSGLTLSIIDVLVLRVVLFILPLTLLNTGDSREDDVLQWALVLTGLESICGSQSKLEHKVGPNHTSDLCLLYERWHFPPRQSCWYLGVRFLRCEASTAAAPS